MLKVSSKHKPRHEKRVEERIEVSKELLVKTTVGIADLVKRVKAEVERGNVKYYTPYTLAQAFNIKISDAKKVLREATRLGILKLYSGGRRAPIYVPAIQPKAQQEVKAK